MVLLMKKPNMLLETEPFDKPELSVFVHYYAEDSFQVVRPSTRCCTVHSCPWCCFTSLEPF